MEKGLISVSLEKADAMDCESVAVSGHPGNYIPLGFKSCKRCDITAADGSCPCAMLAIELHPGAVSGHRWRYRESSVFDYDSTEAKRFDSLFEHKERAHTKSQE